MNCDKLVKKTRTDAGFCCSFNTMDLNDEIDWSVEDTKEDINNFDYDVSYEDIKEEIYDYDSDYDSNYDDEENKLSFIDR